MTIENKTGNKSLSKNDIDNLLSKFQDTEIIDSSNRNRVVFRCKIHDVNYELSYNRKYYYDGIGCEKCRRDKMSSGFKLSKKDVEDRIIENNPNVEIVENDYKKQGDIITLRCKIHDNVYQQNSTVAMRGGTGCEHCKKDKGILKLKHDDVVSKILELNPNVEVLSKYDGHKTKLILKCKNHDIEYYQSPADAMSGKFGCKKCRREDRKSGLKYEHDEIERIIKEKNPNVDLLGKYIKQEIPLSLICNIHNHKYEQNAQAAMEGLRGCEFCKREDGVGGVMKVHEDVVKK